MNQDQTPMSGQMPTIPNVLLVHGAWADGSSWGGVIPLLRSRGHTVVAVQLALNSLADDVAHTRQVLADRLQGPTVLVGHSYGGAVISGAAVGQPNAVALVYASAFAPDAGESLGELSGRYPPAPLGEHLQPDSQGKLWIDPSAFADVFCQDVDATQAGIMAAAQGHWRVPSLGSRLAQRPGARCPRGISSRPRIAPLPQTLSASSLHAWAPRRSKWPRAMPHRSPIPARSPS